MARESDRMPEPPTPVPEIPEHEQVERWDILDRTPLEDLPEDIREIVRRRHGRDS